MSNYFPSLPSNLDPTLREQLKQIWMRVNSILERMDRGDGGTGNRKGVQTQSPLVPSVSIPAAADSLLGQQTYANPQGTQFSSNEVTLNAAGDGIEVTGNSGAGTVNVSNPSALRTAIGVAGVTAHTIVLAKITPTGTDGSITWDANGWITGYVDPT